MNELIKYRAGTVIIIDIFSPDGFPLRIRVSAVYSVRIRYLWNPLFITFKEQV